MERGEMRNSSITYPREFKTSISKSLLFDVSKLGTFSRNMYFGGLARFGRILLMMWRRPAALLSKSSNLFPPAVYG